MARSDGNAIHGVMQRPVPPVPAHVARVAARLKASGPHVLETPYDGKPYFGTRWCGRCAAWVQRAEEHSCRHGLPCGFVYEVERGVQRAVGIRCPDCDAAAR